MRKLMLMGFVLPVLAVFIVFGCLSYAMDYEDGIYEGSGTGYRGIISVRVSVFDGWIDDIEILEHNEDGFAVSAMEELLELILETGSIELDAVSGATVSSEGFLTAVGAALKRRD